jgi:hypothetical protein
MQWQLKAITQKFVSLLPYSREVNYLLHRYVTVGADLPEAFVLDKLHHASQHLKSQQQFGKVKLSEATVLEIGTGWYPVVPMALMLMGAKRIFTADIHPLYSANSINQSIHALLRLADQNKLEALLPGFHRDKLLRLQQALHAQSAASKMQILHLCPVCFIKPFQSLNKGPFDLIVSNNTLQFVEPTQIANLLDSLQRAMALRAVISLAIDYTDEFSHADSRIGPFHFLRFSKAQWRFWSNSLNAPNRLRHIDYRRIFTSKFVLMEEALIMEEPLILKKTILHPDFLHYKEDELLVKHAYLVGIKDKD